MKKFTLLLFSVGAALTQIAFAQTESLLPDQNPNYYTSKAKYLQIADSVNRFHSTTLQNTYEAYDWYEAKQKRRYDRISFRRELRLQRARNQGYWTDNWNNRWGNYNYYYPRFSPLYDVALPFLLFDRWWR